MEGNLRALFRHSIKRKGLIEIIQITNRLLKTHQVYNIRMHRYMIFGGIFSFFVKSN
jgi:hypothetical protein